jgi:hypothetical protein
MRRTFFGSKDSQLEEVVPSLALLDSTKEPSPPIVYPSLSSDTTLHLLTIEPVADFREPLVCSFEELDLRDALGYSGFSALSYR